MRQFLTILLLFWFTGPTSAGEKNDIRAQLQLFQGTWKMVSRQMDGVECGASGSLVVHQDRFKGLGSAGQLKILRGARRNRCDLIVSEDEWQIRAIYEFDGTRLSIAFLRSPLPIHLPVKRPRTFRGDPDRKQGLVVFAFVRQTPLEVALEKIRSQVKGHLFAAADALEDMLRPAGDREHRVAQIFIVGNETVPDWVIRRELDLRPGERLHSWRMWLGEFRLARLGLFEVNLIRGNRPRVTALDWEGEFVDLLVEVAERVPK